MDPFYVIAGIGLVTLGTASTLIYRRIRVFAAAREQFTFIPELAQEEEIPVLIAEPELSADANRLPVLLGLVGAERDVQIEERVVPGALARKLLQFPAEFRNASAGEKQAAWEALRSEVGPHIAPDEMAALERFSFVSKSGEKVWGQFITPILRQRYRVLERRCAKVQGTRKEAYQEFRFLSAAWQVETGHELNVLTSKVFRQVFTQKYSRWKLLKLMFNNILRPEGLES